MTAFVYDFYEDHLGNDPLYNRRKPVIFSIASLRKQTKDQIVVYDSGLIKQNWDPYQDGLDFEVRDGKSMRLIGGHPWCDARSMQRIWLLEECYDDNQVALVSPNMLFFGRPGIGKYQDFLCGGDREGIYFHNQKSYNSKNMLERWQAYCTLFLECPNAQKRVMEFNKNNLVNENIIMNYILSNEIPSCWRPVDEGVSLPFFYIFRMLKRFHVIKSLCLTEAFVGIDKVKIIGAFKELYDVVKWPTFSSHIKEMSGFDKPPFRLEQIMIDEDLQKIRKLLGLEEFLELPKDNPLWVPPIFTLETMRY